MSLKLKIEGEIKEAMKSKDKVRLTALRAIKSQILLAETEKGADGGLNEDVELKLLQRQAKQRRDSLSIYQEQGRTDLAEVEEAELNIIEEFLPKQMSEDEVRVAVQEVISQVGASGPQDMGKVMGAATKSLSGQADGKIISQIARELLS